MTHNFDAAMIDPENVFSHPDDVLRSDFDNEQKRKILVAWEDQLQQRQNATAEGMGKQPGAEAVAGNLQAVATALSNLDS